MSMKVDNVFLWQTKSDLERERGGGVREKRSDDESLFLGFSVQRKG